MQEQKNPWIDLVAKEVYENPWISVTHNEVMNPSNKRGIYGVVHFKNLAIGIVPLDEELNTWLVGQWRYPLGEYSWEIPEGGGRLSVDPIESAKRELLEECGIIAETYEELFKMHLSNSVSDEAGVVYMAKGLSFTEAQPEESEQLQVRKLPLTEAIAMCERGEITDSLSVGAMMKMKIMLLQKEL